MGMERAIGAAIEYLLMGAKWRTLIFPTANFTLTLIRSLSRDRLSEIFRGKASFKLVCLSERVLRTQRTAKDIRNTVTFVENAALCDVSGIIVHLRMAKAVNCIFRYLAEVTSRGTLYDLCFISAIEIERERPSKAPKSFRRKKEINRALQIPG